MSQKNGSYVSVKGGKFRIEVEYSFTDTGVKYMLYMNITNAFDKEEDFTLKWCDASGKQQSKKYTGSAGYKKVARHKLKTITVAKYEIPVAMSISVGGSASKIDAHTIVSTSKPTAPSIRVNTSSPTIWTIDVSGNASINTPVNKVYLEYTNKTAPVESDWSDVGYDTFTQTTGSYSASFQFEVDEGTAYKFRAKASGVKSSTEYASAYTVDNNMYYTNPSGGGSGDMEDDNTYSWTANLGDIDTGVVQGWYIRRSTDGGAYTTIATVYARSGQQNYTYTDYSQTAGHSYSYTHQPFGKGGSSYDDGGGSGTTPVITKPMAPSKVTAYRSTGDTIKITITGGNEYVEDVYIERSIDGGEWAEIATHSYPYDSYTDTVSSATDNILYRVRYSNDVGYSSYTTSNIVVIKKPPLAPSLTAPSANATRALDDGSIQFTWIHKPQDGAPQTAAVFEYKVNSGNWQTVSLTDEAYYILNISGMSPNDNISWRVKTKGYHADYSPYSETRHVLLMAKPEIVITAPTETITDLPVTLGYDYDDNSGNLVRLVIQVIDNNKVVKEYIDTEVKSTGSYTYVLNDFLFESGKLYMLRVEALSSSGLQAAGMITTTVDYDLTYLEGGLYPMIEPDEETGFVYVTIAREIGDDEEEFEPLEVSQAYLYRTVDGERTFIAEVGEGYQLLDKYAPLNKAYNYELLMLLGDGRASLATVESEVDGSASFIYYEDKICKAIWNPKLQTKLSRPDKKQIRYSGRKYPVSYDTIAREETATFTALIEGEDLMNFIDMMNCGGTGIWKSSQGRVYDADFELTFDRVEQQANDIYNCSLEVSRIEGD